MAPTRTPPTSEEELIILDEGFEGSAYTDSLGYLTIGVGRLIDKRKGGCITMAEASYLLTNDLLKVRAALTATFPWFSSLDHVRQGVMVSLRFQLGQVGLLEFTRFLGDMGAGNWASAASELQESRLAQQAPDRIARHAKALVTGEWQ